jgi:hypothetical protein
VIKLILYLLIGGALAYCGATVKLGKRTFFGHIHAIWESPEGKDLEQGVKETAGPAVHKIEHGVTAGYKAMKEGSAGSAGSGAVAQPTAP